MPTGACWAFASIGAIEAALAMVNASNTPKNLSEQYAIDCSSPVGDCEGGWPADALQLATSGIPLAKNYPYVGRKNKSKKCPSRVRYVLSHSSSSICSCLIFIAL